MKPGLKTNRGRRPLDRRDQPYRIGQSIRNIFSEAESVASRFAIGVLYLAVKPSLTDWVKTDWAIEALFKTQESLLVATPKQNVIISSTAV